MYQGKHLTPKTKKKTAVSYRKRKIALMLSLALILTAAIGGTAAYFMDSEWNISGLRVGKVSCIVAIDDSIVTVTNTGNVPAQVRVAVVANWVNDTGIHYTQPTLTINAEGWSQSGDYFYRGASVGETVTLPVTADGSAPEDYHLKIHALAEAIQENAAADAWGY